MVLQGDLDCLPFSLRKAISQPSWVSQLSCLRMCAVCRVTELFYRVVMGDKPEEAVSGPLKCPQIASPCLELPPTSLGKVPESSHLRGWLRATHLDSASNPCLPLEPRNVLGSGLSFPDSRR